MTVSLRVTGLMIGAICLFFFLGCEDCGDCVKEKCADLVAICDANPDCACMTNCLGDNGVAGVENCLGSCGIEERPFDFIAVEECVAIACPDEDECATPGDYLPPELPSADDTTALESHGGGSDLADCRFDAGLTFDPEGSILQLMSKNGNVCVRVERNSEGTGNLANKEWSLVKMLAGPLGGVSSVDTPENMCWYSSHHNFFDWAHAWTGNVRYDLKLKQDDHGGLHTYALHPYLQGPIDPNNCSPTTDGADPIGTPITLYPFNQ